MAEFKSIEQARDFFKEDSFAMNAGISLDELDEDRSICSMDIVKGKNTNALGSVMGGAIFTLADFAFACASNNLHNPTVSLSMSCNFIGRAKGKKLIAATKCVKNGRTTCVFDIDVEDELGTKVAKFIGTGYKS